MENNVLVKYCLLGLAFWGSLPTASAASIFLDPGSTLRVDFVSNPVATPCPGTCDVLALYLGFATPPDPGVLRTATLYNGSTALGTTTIDSPLGLYFHSASSIFALGTTLDFSPLNSPFQGYFLVTTASALSLEVLGGAVNLGHTTSPFGFSYSAATAQITGINLVPEPRYGSLVGVFFCCGAVLRYVRRRAAQGR